MFARYLHQERIAIGTGATDKPTVLSELAALLAKPDEEHRSAAFRAALLHRESLGGTGVGSGVAIPHGKLNEIERSRAAMLIAPGGVDFGAIDSKPVTIFVALIGPASAPREHLTALAEVSRRLRSDETRQRLIEAKTAADVYAIMSA
ncbi:MAG: PTS sugar transporter subunit IIA [Polyangiales bacterium]